MNVTAQSLLGIHVLSRDVAGICKPVVSQVQPEKDLHSEIVSAFSPHRDMSSPPTVTKRLTGGCGDESKTVDRLLMWEWERH